MSTQELENSNGVNDDEKQESKPKRDPSLKNRIAGQSRTILLYPLSNDIEEAEIEEFIKPAALTAPLRIELFKFQHIDNLRKDQNKNNGDNVLTNYNAYCYVTFSSSSDCWLIKKRLNNTLLRNNKVSICFSSIPRSDLEGKVSRIEFGTNYPPITDKSEIFKFLSSFDDDIKNNKDEDLSMVKSPKYISPAPGHGGIKGKWFITYESPEIATKALEFYSGRYYFDQQNNKNRFVIINYQLSHKEIPKDRKECFFGITDRVVLQNLDRKITDNDDILLFLQNNGFDIDTEILDIYIIHQMTEMLKKIDSSKKKKYGKRKRTRKRNKKRKNDKSDNKAQCGYAIVTFANYKLASKAYTNLNNKIIGENCKINTGFSSPNMTDPLKRLLKNDTNNVHLSNLPWNITKQQISNWLSQAGKKYITKKKHLKKQAKETEDEDSDIEILGDNIDDKDKKEQKNPFYSTEVESGKFYAKPTDIFIKYHFGYSTGRAVMFDTNATFATNEEATCVVEKMNGKELGGRKICVNWALPIKDYKFKEERGQILNIKQNNHKARLKRRQKKGQQKNSKIKVKKADNNDEDELHESIAFKKLKAWQSKRKNRIRRNQKIKKDEFVAMAAKTMGPPKYQKRKKKIKLKQPKMENKMDAKIARWKKSGNKNDDNNPESKDTKKAEKTAKRGIKRKQKFKKPATKRIKLPIE